jgi:hypothetical protein
MVTASTLMAVGDLIAQQIERTRSKPMNQDDCLNIDAIRSMKMVTWTLIGYLPINYVAFRKIEQFFPDVSGSLSLAARLRTPSFLARVATKVFFAVSPSFIINPLFFVYSSVVESMISNSSTATGARQCKVDWENVQSDVHRRFSEDLFPIILAAYKLWTPVQFFNFIFLPVPFRIITVSVFSTFWVGPICFV